MITGGKYHFVGIAGVGMSAVAQAALSAGCVVSGSERVLDPVLCGGVTGADAEVMRKLKKAGVVFVPQDGSGVNAGLDGVVVSTAIENDNPDMTAARAAGVPVMHRSQMLAALVEGNRCIAITGTCGKSTVTGMAGYILEGLGADPSVVNGAPVLAWKSEDRIGNFRAGESGLWVIEADESDRSLLNYHPDYAVITNASADHFSLEETLGLFREFSVQVKTGVVNVPDDSGILTGFAPVVSVRESRFTYKGIEFVLPLPGAHNAENAYLAVVLCERLGYGLEAVRDVLSSFRGIERRMEVAGSAGGVTVIDDYAHNPAKIRAVWMALVPYSKRILGVWRPHGYGPLRNMMEDLKQTFGAICRVEDRLFLLPVYDAGGTADRSVKSDDLAESLTNAGVGAVVTEPADVLRTIAGLVDEGDTVLVMGARDPGLSQLAREIGRRLKAENWGERGVEGLKAET